MIEGGKRQRIRTTSKVDLLPDPVKDQVDDLLRDTRNTFDSISEWLKEQGFDVSKSAVGRYSLRTNRTADRVAQTIAQTKAIAKVVEQNPNLDFSKASQIILLDQLTQRVATAEEEFSEMPLDKAGRLIASLSRVELYEKRVKQDLKKKIELAFGEMEGQLTQAIKQDPELTRELHAVLTKARERILGDD